MTILRDFIDAQHLHCERLTSIILHHAAQPGAVTIESGNTADLADLEAMRGTLDGAGYSPTPTGLRGLLDLVERLDQRCEEANELDRRHAEALATISDLRAQVAALTPGPWTRLGDMAPDSGETVLMRTGVVGLPWMQFVSEDTVQHLPADYLWRRFPAGLLDVPAPTVAPTNAQPEGAC